MDERVMEAMWLADVAHTERMHRVKKEREAEAEREMREAFKSIPPELQTEIRLRASLLEYHVAEHNTRDSLFMEQCAFMARGLTRGL